MQETKEKSRAFLVELLLFSFSLIKFLSKENIPYKIKKEIYK